MDPASWWRVGMTVGALTGLVALAGCAAIIGSTQSELNRAIQQMRSDYKLMDSRLSLLSNRMDALEQQILKVLLHPFPTTGGETE